MKTHILLLEDDQDSFEQFETILQNDGYEVHHAFNGGQALKIIENPKIPLSLAILDLNINMPGDLEKDHLGEVTPMRRGVAVAQKLLEKRGALPIIFASAYGDDAKKIVDAAGFNSPHVFYKKETIFKDVEIINNSISLALEKVEEVDNAQRIFSHRMPGTLTVRINHTRKQGDGNDNIFRVIKRSEIAYILNDKVWGIGIHLIDGKTVHRLTHIGPKLLDKQYQQMIEATGEDDFLIRGTDSERFALWANKDAIYGYDNNNLFFVNEVNVTIGNSMRTNLKKLFPPFKTN